MGKLLINFSDAQEEWLRAENEAHPLPGGVSEHLRRIVDEHRERKSRMNPTTTTSRERTNISEAASILYETMRVSGNDDEIPTFAELAERFNTGGGFSFEVRYGHETRGSYTRVEGCVLSPEHLKLAMEEAERRWERDLPK